MKIRTIAATVAALSILGGCGGSGDADSGSSDPPPGAATYPEVAPTLGSLDTFTVTTVDDSNNTISQGYEERVTAVGSDGSYQLNQDDPNNQTISVNGITYHDDPTVRQYGGAAANGFETGYTVTLPGGATTSCSLAVLAGGLKRPLYAGQAWTTNYTVTCGSSTTGYLESGTVDDLESVTVPAGTFTALKETYSIAWTTSGGEDIVEHVDAWVDPAHAFFTLKRVIAYQRSGNLPAHYVTGETVLLQSRQ